MLQVSRKSDVKLLRYLGIQFILVGLTFIGLVLDFFNILITSKNIDNSNGIVGILYWVFTIPTAIIFMYYTFEIILPEEIFGLEKKRFLKWFLSLFTLQSFIILVYIVMNPEDSLTFVYPSPPGSDLIDINLSGLISLIILIEWTPIMLFIIIGFFYRGMHSTGVIRRKFFILSVATALFNISSVLDYLELPTIALVFIRIGAFVSAWCWYYGLRESPAESEKEPKIKEIQVEEGVFRLTKRPDHITEEEVSLSKEKKVCLVCKSKVVRYNVYVCPECEAIYCHKCAHALEDLENACWVCNAPFDESKPIKRVEEIEEEITFEKK